MGTPSKGITRWEIFTILVIIGILCAMLLPEVQQVRNDGRRERFKNQMKSIGLALHLYQDKYGCLPSVMLKDDKGLPIHSWRALLLPFLKNQYAFENHRLDYAFDEPWDSAHNQKIASQSSNLFRAEWISKDDTISKSKLVAIIDSTYWSSSEDIRPLISGTNTDEQIILMEIPNLKGLWTEPSDISLEELCKLIESDAFSTWGAYVLYADGHAWWLSPEEISSPNFLKRLTEREISDVEEQ